MVSTSSCIASYTYVQQAVSGSLHDSAPSERSGCASEKVDNAVQVLQQLPEVILTAWHFSLKQSFDTNPLHNPTGS